MAFHGTTQLETPTGPKEASSIVKGKLVRTRHHDFQPANRVDFQMALLMAWMPPPDGIAMFQCDEC
jgi:hypothetical protein